MDNHATNTNYVEEQPLRFSRSELYDQLIDEFGKFGIHPYDVEASAIEKQEGIELILRFGHEFTQSARCYFSQAALHDQKEIVSFFKQSAEACQKAMIADYYKMMKP